MFISKIYTTQLYLILKDGLKLLWSVMAIVARVRGVTPGPLIIFIYTIIPSVSYIVAT